MWLAWLLACNPDPGDAAQGVDYRDRLDTGPQSAERGNVVVSEVLWSGSVGDAGWDPDDVFVELRNEGSMPVDVTGWLLVFEGSPTHTWAFPAGGPEIGVGAHAFVAAKSDGCFPTPDWTIQGMSFRTNDPFEITLRDFDEHLVEPVGSTDMPPFAGGFDGVISRSMERVELMFGGEGTDPHMWHFATHAPVDVANDDRVAEPCRALTWATPGRANSPDYSGAYASGSLE
jgi:hypothetical protein